MSKRPHDDDVFVADPDDLEADLDAVRPRWPKVVGVVSIILGALGILCNGMGAVWFSVGQPFVIQQGIDAGAIEGGVPPFMTQPHLPMIVLCLVGALTSILLIVAGGSTIGRKPAGRSMHLAYGVIAVLLFAGSTYVNLSLQAQTAQWAQQNPNSTIAQQANQQAFQNMIGMVVGVIFGLGWPVFCLIWFGAVKKRPEDMTGGVQAPAA